MAIYLLLFISVPCWYLLLKKHKKIYVSVIAIELLALLLLRSPQLGVDMSNYSAGYAYIAGLSAKEMFSSLNFLFPADIYNLYAYESGYVVLNWVLSHIGIGFQGFLVLYAFFCVITHSRFIYKYSKNPCLTFLIFIAFAAFGYIFGLLRQSIAASILLLSVDAIRDKKFIKFLLLVLLAFTFHRSALIFLPLYFASKIKFKSKTFLWGFALYATELIALVTVAKYLIEIVLAAFGKTSYSISAFSLNKFTLLLIASLVFFLLTMNFKKNYEDKNFNLICAGLWLGVYVQLGSSYLDLVGRMYTGYFLLFFALAMSWAMSELKKQSKLMYYGALVMFFGVLLGYYYIYLQTSPNVPYVPFWQAVA